jgi:hypothetical protein
MLDQETVEIAAVGKAISSQNGTKIIGAISYLLDVVANSGILAPEDLQRMFATVAEPGVVVPAHVNEHDSGEPSGDLSAGEPSGDLSGDLDKVQASAVESIQASSCCLLTTIEKRTWQNNLSTAMDTYRMKLRDVLFYSDDMLARENYPKDRAKTLAGFTDDLISFLTDSAKKYKPEYRGNGFMREMSFPMPMPMTMAAREAEVQAGRFTDSIERRAWNSRLDSTIDIFMSYFSDLVKFTDAEIDSMYEVKDRPAAIAKILKELKTALSDIIESFPPCLRSANDADKTKKLMQLSAQDADTEEIVLELVGLQLSAKDPAQLNRRPMEGMLFPIDSPSEATPAVGPGLPLFVPRSVAMGLVNRVSGLPLDADESLSKHANKQIVGVINAASIEGNEFRVNGYIYDWSQPEMAALISANKQSLGMSMNAMAKGSPRDVDGRKVFFVESLELMGANILKSSKATFTGTNLIAASAADTEDAELIGENTPENDFVSPDFASIVGQLNELTEGEDFAADDLELDDLLTDLGEIADVELDLADDSEEDEDFESSEEDPELDTEIQLSTEIMTDIERLSQQVEQFAANVNETLGHVVQAQSVLNDDYASRQQQAAIQAAHQEQEDATYAAESIADLTISKLLAMGLIQQPIAAAATTAPAQDHVPARRTVAIAAAAATTEAATESQPLLLQLASIDGQLNVLEDMPGTGEKMNALIQQATEIRAQLAHLR